MKLYAYTEDRVWRLIFAKTLEQLVSYHCDWVVGCGINAYYWVLGHEYTWNGNNVSPYGIWRCMKRHCVPPSLVSVFYCD